jgi:DNA-binding SARP family transcriptional activator
MQSEPASPTWGALREGWRLAHEGDGRARAQLAAARAALRAEGDAAGVAVAAAAMLVTGQVEGDYRDFEACLLDIENTPRAALHADDALLAEAGLLTGLLCLRPNDPALDACVQRLLPLLENTADANTCSAAGRLVLFYAEPRERRELGQRVNALVRARGTDGATPYRHAQWLWFWRRVARFAKEPHQAEQADTELRALIERHDLRRMRFLLTIVDIEASLPRGDLRGAEAAVDRAETLVDATRLRELMMLAFSRARLARLRGDADSALLHASRARKIAVDLRSPSPTLAVYIVNEAQARLQAGDVAGAQAQMAEALPMVPAGFADEIGAMIDALAAWAAWLRGAPEARAWFAALWQRLRERQSYDLFEGYPAFTARLAALALTLGIETGFVCSLIEKNGLAPPPDAPDGWPWPLRIHALGGLRVARQGVPLGAQGKAQKRPLALLQAVLAHGATDESHGVDIDTLIAALWPDEEASDPKASFDATLLRLRRWLGVDGALKVVDGRLALDAHLVWCDVAAFERCFDALQRQLRPHTDATPLPALAERLTTLYAGPLFGSAALEPWAVAPRHRLALKFSRAITDLGLHLETHRAFDQALRLYERGLAQDILAEPIYRALMRCHLALGQRSEAATLYRRCCEVLMAALMVGPAAETVALAASIVG